MIIGIRSVEVFVKSIAEVHISVDPCVSLMMLLFPGTIYPRYSNASLVYFRSGSDGSVTILSVLSILEIFFSLFHVLVSTRRSYVELIDVGFSIVVPLKFGRINPLSKIVHVPSISIFPTSKTYTGLPAVPQFGIVARSIHANAYIISEKEMSQNICDHCSISVSTKNLPASTCVPVYQKVSCSRCMTVIPSCCPDMSISKIFRYIQVPHVYRSSKHGSPASQYADHIIHVV